MRKIFFDTEFTGLHQNTTLVSIGLVSDEGERFYAELTDYDETQCDDWITKNVLDHLLLSGNTELEKELEEDELTTRVIGNRDDVRTALLNWLDGFGDDIQFVSDVCHYDMVLLCELIADGAMLLPEYINPFCHDLCQDISMILDISEKAAFDISREQLLTDRGIDLPKGQKHNALYDAEVIKAIYEDFFSVGGNKEVRMDNGMELRVKDYCAFCPDFEADVDKVDITVLADRTQRALTTIRCEHAEKCERIYGRIQEGRTNETTVVQSSV